MATPEGREILLQAVEDALRPAIDRHPGRIDNQTRLDPWFTVEQFHLLEEAVKARGYRGDAWRDGKFRTVLQQYVLRATMAMVAYDLGKDFLEIFTGDPLPAEPLRGMLVKKARDRWGYWGIRELGDHTATFEERDE